MNCNAIVIGQPTRPRWCGVPMVVNGWALSRWEPGVTPAELRWWERRGKFQEAAVLDRCQTGSSFGYELYPPRAGFPDRFASDTRPTARAAREAADRDLASWAATGCPLCIPCRFGELMMWRTYRAPACQ